MTTIVSKAPRFPSFTAEQSAGSKVVTTFAFISTIAILSVATRALWLAIRRKMDPVRAKPREYIFFNTQLGHYATCLLVSNLCMGIAGVLDVRWISENGITPDTFCTFQGVLMQLGSWATAYFTVTIAVHTFNSLVLKRRQSIIVSAVTICLGWITAGLLAAGPFVQPNQYTIGPAYGADGLSCGIRSVYLKAQFFFHLFPIFVASVLSAILYSLIFLVLRGTLNIKGGIRLTLDPNEKFVSEGVTENYHKFVARIARSMVWYPVAYIALLVPYSVTRLLSISGFNVSFPGLIFACVCWFLLGSVNVFLLYNTFRVLGPAVVGSQNESNMSFGPNLSMEKDPRFRQFPQPTPTYHSPKPSSSGDSTRALISQDSASAASFYSYPTSESLGRPITPFDELERAMAPSARSPKEASSPSGNQKLHISTDSLGLPAPPRRTRSPIVQYPSVESVRQPEPSFQPNRMMGSPQLNKQISTTTFGQPASARQSAASDYDVDEWYSRRGDGMLSPPGSGKNTAFLLSPPSRGSPNFPARPLPNLPRHSRSFSAVNAAGSSPTARQRPLLLPTGMAGYEDRAGHVRSSSGQARVNYV
jgi:hypothetical protein